MNKHCCLCKYFNTPRICALICKRTGEEFEYSNEALKIFEEIKYDI